MMNTNFLTHLNLINSINTFLMINYFAFNILSFLIIIFDFIP